MDGGWRRAFRLPAGASRIRREVDDELAFHLEMREQQLIAGGMDPDTARRQARRQFGNVEAIRRRCLTLDTEMERDMRRADLMEELRRDLAYALRALGSQRGFTAVVILTLGIGIGATTAIFSLVDALLLRPIPVSRPEQLITIGQATWVGARVTGGPTLDIFSYPLYRDLRERNRLVSGLLASGRTGRLTAIIPHSPSRPASDSATGGGEERPRGRFVSTNYFSVLGVPATRGRVFTPDPRDGADEPVVVISHGYWQRRFALDPGAVGRTITLNDVPVTIIGVAPEGFFGEIVGQAPDLWIPIGLQPRLMPNESYLEDRQVSWLLLMGRLAAGVTVAQARSGFNQLARQLLDENSGRAARPATETARAPASEVSVLPGDKGFSRLRHTFGPALLVLMAAVVLVLLIVCANVANLLLARAAARRGEVAVRLALGAGRARLVRQLLIESMVLAAMGALLGLVIASWGSTTLLRTASPTGAPIPLATQLDPRVLGFASGVALVTVLLFGLAPALRATRLELADALKSRTRGATGGSLGALGHGLGPGKLLVVGQVALSVLLLVSAGLLLRTTQRLATADVGYERDGLVIVKVASSEAGYEGDRLAGLARALHERFRAVPGVSAVTYSENGLFSGTESSTTLSIAGFVASTEEDTSVNYDHVGPDYLATIGARLLRGRDIREDDLAGRHRVVVINDAMARFYFPGQDPIGRHIVIDSIEHEIVGVAADVKGNVIREAPTRRLYAPFQQMIGEIASLHYELRVAGNVEGIADRIRSESALVDASVRIASVDRLVHLMRQSIAEERLFARLATLFGGLALLLALIGLYGVMTYAIVRRTAEFGLRMALGAGPGDVLSLVLRESLWLVTLGALLGVPAAVTAARLLRSQLFGVTPVDPLIILAVLALLTLCGALAALLPASRASRVDPLEALRAE
ncbi:MAG TPA: ABC transporter permease [Gemmatimonadaceae bacterium]|jgi:predicted permease|nr:ABC transporter permease [Gemmatimonadaceae bacterium]